MYKLYKNIKGDICGVQKLEGKMLHSIPFDPANTDYQVYLKWLDEGGIPEPADK